MKKLIRIVLKVPVTPFFVSAMLVLLAASYLLQFFEWVYDAHNSSKQITGEMIYDIKRYLMWWFTTL